jgi:hypothetical protein
VTVGENVNDTVPRLGDIVADDALFRVGQDGSFLAARWRDSGIAQVLDHADGWARQTIESGIRGFASTGDPFAADDVVELLPALPPGTSPNVIGAVFAALAKQGELRHVGYRKSRRPESHRRVVSVWVGCAEPNGVVESDHSTVVNDLAVRPEESSSRHTAPVAIIGQDGKTYQPGTVVEQPAAP